MYTKMRHVAHVMLATVSYFHYHQIGHVVQPRILTMVASPYLPTYARHPLYVPLAETRRLHGYNIETPLGDDKMERRNTRSDKSEVESKKFFGYV